MQQNQFLIRRLHSLSGIVPIGVFLMVHLFTNSSLAWGWFALKGRGQSGDLSVTEGGVQYFAHEVTWINTQMPHLFLIEVTLWVAIAFHCILGFYYALGGKGNLPHYKHQDNFRYTLQRLSGYFGIFFIFYHIATLRWGWTFLVPEGTRWTHDYSASTLAAALQGSTGGWTALGLAVSLFYLLGVSLLVFHFANGLWTAAITWGLTVSEHAQKRWGYVCAVLGFGMMLAAWSALGSAMLLDYDKAHAVEASMHGGTHQVDPAADHAIGDEVTLETNLVDPEG
jgi:succinate dehydrogenase / fumarate reductase cytochrome b subunit